MYCCIPDPALASLLAQERGVTPREDQARLLIGFLAVQVLGLLAVGVFPR